MRKMVNYGDPQVILTASTLLLLLIFTKQDLTEIETQMKANSDEKHTFTTEL